MPKLVVKQNVYDSDSLEAWIKRRRDALPFPATSADLARLLRRKARGRSARTRRFFGEAYVASRTPHREAYYASYKWLTNRKFASSKKCSNRHQEQLRKALQDHFGLKQVEKLQRTVQELSRSCRKELAGKTPTAPDLWLVDRRGQHRFIEVKLPGDSVAPHQLAGMAAIACVLKGSGAVLVEVIHLQDDDRMFKRFCRAMRSP